MQCFEIYSKHICIINYQINNFCTLQLMNFPSFRLRYFYFKFADSNQLNLLFNMFRSKIKKQKIKQLSKQKINSIPTLKTQNDIFASVQKGFMSFTVYQRQIQQTSFKNSHIRNKTVDKFKTEPNTVTRTLQSNCIKLNKLNLSIISRRDEEYKQFITQSMQYNKLLELNNQRSKILTSLTKNKIGEIKIKNIQEIKPQDYIYYVQYSYQQISMWKPQPRQGQICIVHKDSMFLLGGHNSNPLNDICIYNFKDNTWTKAFKSNLSRTYHSAVVYKDNYIVIFGGMSYFNPYYKTRQCLNSSCLYGIGTNVIKNIKISNEEEVQPRRNHSAGIIGKYMYIFGGINTQKNYLSDLKYMNLKQLKWESRQYKASDHQLETYLSKGIAKHVMIQNFIERESYPLYSSKYQQNQGFYIFGGTNQADEQSILLHLSFKRRVAFLKRLIPGGIPPSTICPIIKRLNQNILVIISGENYLREMKLYRIKENVFVDIHNSYSLPCLGGIGSSLIKYKDQFYVFFGLGQQGYLSNILKLKIQEKIRETAKKRRETISRRKYSFIQQSDSNTETDNNGFTYEFPV